MTRDRRNRRSLKRTLQTIVTWCAVLLSFFILYREGALETLMGRYKVNDGDSLEFGNDRIRLLGIDAPELYQTCKSKNGFSYDCGKDAKHALQRIIGSNDIECKKSRTDKYGRKLALCSMGTLDINAEMVRQGWAVAYDEFGTNYLTLENRAKNARLGIWQGPFENPSDYRKRNRRSGAAFFEDDD
jgi:endonuclease YncB( thermonuclease family)